MIDAIVAYDLTKFYGGRAAVSGLNLQIPEGDAFACVGPARSGKKTLIRLLSGLCRPTSGECAVWGFSPVFEAARLHAVTGTVLDTAGMYSRMTVSENLRFFAGVNGVDENDSLDRMSFLLHRLDIWESRDVKADELSTGAAHRASLARALMHRPKVLLMDESTRELDQETAESVRELVQYLTEQEGVTVLLCTQDLQYAQNVCRTFGLLQKGKLVSRGSLEELCRGAGVRFRAVLRLGEGETAPSGFKLTEGKWEKEIQSEEELPKIISQVVSEGKNLYEAVLARPTLEEIYAAVLAGGVYRVGDPDEQTEPYQKPAETAADRDGGEDQAVQPVEPDKAGAEAGQHS